MKLLLPCLRLALVCLAICATHPAFAADTPPATGSVTGRVQNRATGQYLNNVRIAVKGSDTVVFSDPTGTYRLAGLPAGEVVLEGFFTGLDAMQATVTVPRTGTVTQDFELTSTARFGADAATAIKLDAFTVSTARETDNAAIAINEQRFAPNIKNVITADALGDVMDGNVGEFLKFMPGITAEYDRESGGSVASVAVRGFPTAQAVVSGDGLQMANTSNPMGSSRVFQFTQVSINNIARIEVYHSPTPESPGSALAGGVNMVPRGAFERARPQFSGNTYFLFRDAEKSLRKTPGPIRDATHKNHPGWDFSWVVPVNKRFGFTLSGG